MLSKLLPAAHYMPPKYNMLAKSDVCWALRLSSSLLESTTRDGNIRSKAGTTLPSYRGAAQQPQQPNLFLPFLGFFPGFRRSFDCVFTSDSGRDAPRLVAGSIGTDALVAGRDI